MKFKILLIIFCVASNYLHAQIPITKTNNGKVQGSLSVDKGIRIYKGIPFAAAPVGNLRWKAPQPVQNWKGVKSCTQFSASPIQNKPEPFYCWSAEFIAKPEPLSEDCLYLNVWTPAKKRNEKLPVFVWIYGGGLSSGSANCDIYDGEEMAKKGIIFVSINYRVGVLGFMAHPALSKESGHNASGNYGFLDQIAALKWVQKNIAAFGGNPNNVTIAGQSAGAFSVNALIASSLAKGLFHKAIPQSGGLLGASFSQNLEQSEAQGIKFMEKANCTSLAELRSKSPEDIQKLSNSQDLGRFGVTLDGYVMPTNLMEHFKNGLHNQVPVLAGWVLGDGGLLGQAKGTLADYNNEADTKYGKKAGEFLNIFPAKTDEEVVKAKTKLGLMNFAGLPAHNLAILTNKTSYLYQFSHVPPDKPNFPNYGAFHTSEVPYALHTLHTWERPWQAYDTQLENTMASYWVNFTKTGNPNGPGLPEWKSYDKANGNIMEFGDKVLNIKALFKKEFDFLEANL